MNKMETGFICVKSIVQRGNGLKYVTTAFEVKKQQHDNLED